MEKKLIVKEDMICPISNHHCDDECCTVGTECNLSGRQSITSCNKQTAVQWLSNHWAKLQKDGEKMSWQQIIDITNLALQMEREQIEEAFDESDKITTRVFKLGLDAEILNGKQYYTQTFKP